MRRADLPLHALALHAPSPDVTFPRIDFWMQCGRPLFRDAFPFCGGLSPVAPGCGLVYEGAFVDGLVLILKREN